ncbi:hypothetical protein Tco_0438694 [Tanacetum coccineum]
MTLTNRCVDVFKHHFYVSLMVLRCVLSLEGMCGLGSKYNVVKKRNVSLLGGAIDISEANEIIRDPKLELESSHFTFDLVPLSYKSVDVVILLEKSEIENSSGAKKKISRCGRNQLGNEPILALPEGADDFVVYYDAQSKDLEACLEKKGEEALSERDSRWMKLFSEYGFEAKYHLGKANVDVVPWSRKKE